MVLFFFSWLPYIFISRATYIYHFYLSVPLMILALTYFINKIWNKPLGKVLTVALFASAVILFFVFYPVISGAPASSSYIHTLKWLPGLDFGHDPNHDAAPQRPWFQLFCQPTTKSNTSRLQ